MNYVRWHFKQEEPRHNLHLLSFGIITTRSVLWNQWMRLFIRKEEECKLVTCLDESVSNVFNRTHLKTRCLRFSSLPSMEACYLRTFLDHPFRRNVGSRRLSPHYNVRWILVWKRLFRPLYYRIHEGPFAGKDLHHRQLNTLDFGTAVYGSHQCL